MRCPVRLFSGERMAGGMAGWNGISASQTGVGSGNSHGHSTERSLCAHVLPQVSTLLNEIHELSIIFTTFHAGR